MEAGSVMTLEFAGETPQRRVLDLYREHGRHLYGYALGLVGEPADAEDAVQDAFLRLDRHLCAGGDDSNLRAWLYRVITNLCRDVLRSRRRVAVAPPGDRAARGDALTALALRRVLERLAPRDRELVLMRGRGLSYAEMAAAAGIRPASVGKTLARALERFVEAYRREVPTKEVD